MVKDTLNSMLDNIKERTTNPFLGTFVIIWIVKNWKLVYSLFYFDSAFTLDARLSYIECYFRHKSFWLNIFEVVGFTILVLVGTYIFLAISRLLTEFYDKVVVPKIAEATNKSSVVLKETYNELEEAFRLLEKRYEEERLAKIAAQNERDASDAKLLEQISKQAQLSKVVNDSRSTPASFLRVSNKALQEWTRDKFNNYLTNITNGTLMSAQDDIMKVLLRENFITPAGRSGSAGKDYKLTSEGQDFLRYWNDITDEASKL